MHTKLLALLFITVIASTQLRTNEQEATPPHIEINIEKVMNYPIPQVIARYKRDYNVSDQLAKVHEKELKRFLIIAAQYDENMGMYSKEVDNLWHTFIIFTKDYARFCKKMFGKFIHHVPKEITE